MTVKLVCLGEIIELSGREKVGTRELPLMSITMHDGLIDQADRFKKRIASKEISGYKLVRLNELVVGFPIDEGVLGFQRKYEAAAVSPAYDVWRVRDASRVDLTYLEMYLRSPRAISAYRAKMRGAVSRRRVLTKEDFQEVVVPLPSLKEQRRTATILDKASALRSTRREAIAKLDQLLQSVFLDMFGDPAMNPKGWPIGEVSDLLESLKYGSSEKASLQGDVPILRMNNLSYSGEIDLTDLKYISKEQAEEKYTVRSGDILFNRTNSKELVGKTAMYDGPTPMAYAGYLVRARTLPAHAPEYISAFMNSVYGKSILRSMCKNIVGMANINAREFGAMAIPVPPSDLQLKFKETVSVTKRRRKMLNEQKSVLDKLFLSLQQRAFAEGL